MLPPEDSDVEDDLRPFDELNESETAVLEQLVTACKRGFIKRTQELLDEHGVEYIKTRDAAGHTLLHWAALGGSTNLVEILLQYGALLDVHSDNDYGPRPIHWACVHGHVTVIDQFLEKGVSIETMDYNRCTPLLIAAQYGQSLVISYLLKKGANKDHMDINKDTALHWAAYKGHPEAVLILLSWGLDPKQKDAYQQTPVHSSSINGDVQCMEMLLDHGGDITEADVNGKTPPTLAKGRKHKDLLRLFDNRTEGDEEWKWKNILYGPPGNKKWPVWFLVVAMVLWTYPLYIFKIVPATLEVAWNVHLMLWVSTVVFWVLYYLARFTDPGYLRSNKAQYDEAVRMVGNPSAWSEYTDLNNPVFLMCHSCRLVKPIRAKHCRRCNRCVDHFDHHCFWIGNCVGYNNRVYFVLFVYMLVLQGLLGAYLMWLMVRTDGLDTLLVMAGTLLALHSIPALYSCVFQSRMALMNMTTNENTNYFRYRHFKKPDGTYSNPFNRGVIGNLKEFLYLQRPPYMVRRSDPYKV